MHDLDGTFPLWIGGAMESGGEGVPVNEVCGTDWPSFATADML